MTQASKKKKNEKPMEAPEKDAELAEFLFGKRLKKELDKVIEDRDKKGIPDFMKR